MKKVILALLLVFLFAGCKQETEQPKLTSEELMEEFEALFYDFYVTGEHNFDTFCNTYYSEDYTDDCLERLGYQEDDGNRGIYSVFEMTFTEVELVAYPDFLQEEYYPEATENQTVYDLNFTVTLRYTYNDDPKELTDQYIFRVIEEDGYYLFLRLSGIRPF